MAQSNPKNLNDPFNPVPSSEFNSSSIEESKQRDIRAAEAAAEALRPTKKRLIICCDGTWQSSNHGLKSVPSNVAKISRAIAKFTKDENGAFIHQVVFYDAGVGTATDTSESRGAKVAKKREGAFGEGLDENVCEAYNFLVNNYNRGDELYFFGFSRGAYTARAAAGLVATVGLCTNSMMDDFYQMYNAYKGKNANDPITDTAWGKGLDGLNWLNGCDRNVNIKVVGVFDTVGALGWPNNIHVDVTAANAPFAFHNTEVHPLIENAFQALALDEHRAAFPPTLWSLPKPKTKEEEELDEKNGIPVQKTTNLIQCWFPGYHINIGGGSDHEEKKLDGDFESMANITFAWMVDRVQQYTSLGFDDEAMFDIIDRYEKSIAAVMEKHIYKGWGLGPDVDSMDATQAVAGSIPRTPAQYIKGGRITNEYIHPVVAFALDKSTATKWMPKSFEGFQRIPNPDTKRKGHVWQKTFTPPPPQKEEGIIKKAYSYFGGKSTPVPEGKKVTLTIPEFVIPADALVNGMYTAKAWKGHNMERYLIRADTSRYIYDDQVGGKEKRAVVNQIVNFVKALDRGNGIEETHLKICEPRTFEGKAPANETLIPENDDKALKEFLEARSKEMKDSQAKWKIMSVEEKFEATNIAQADNGFGQGGFMQSPFE